MISRDTSVRTRNTVPFRNSIIHLVVPHYRPLALVEPVIRSNQNPVLKLSIVKQLHLQDQLIYPQPQQHNMLNKQHKLHKLLHWKKKSNNQCKFFFNISFLLKYWLKYWFKYWFQIQGTSTDQEEKEHYSYGNFWLHCWTIRVIQTSLHGRVGD